MRDILEAIDWPFALSVKTLESFRSSHRVEQFSKYFWGTAISVEATSQRSRNHLSAHIETIETNLKKREIVDKGDEREDQRERRIPLHRDQSLCFRREPRIARIAILPAVAARPS
jgi:hypothetical protein